MDNQVNAATIATITTTLGFMQSTMAKIEAKLDALNTTFASKEELAQTAKETQERIGRLERSSQLWRFLSPTLSAIIAGVLVFFITAYFFRG